MLLTDSAKARARIFSGIAAGLALAVALVAYFGLNDGGWMLLVPVLGSAAAVIWPTRVVTAVAMIVSAIIVVVGMDGSGVLFGASVVSLMLALNSLQSAATRIRRRTT